jgi:hypothetical protein
MLGQEMPMRKPMNYKGPERATSCCANPDVTYVREQSTADGGKRKYYKCLNCQSDEVVTEGRHGQVIHREHIPVTER